MSDWLCADPRLNNGNNDNVPFGIGEEQLSIADMVTQTASQVVQQQQSDQFASLGFQWHDEWAVFYNADTGYLYDPNSSLFYHPTTQLYYAFNANTGEYEQIGGGITAQQNDAGIAVKWTKKAHRRRATRIFGDEFVQKVSQAEIELAELTLDLVDRCAFLCGDYCCKRLAKRALLVDQAAAAAVDAGGAEAALGQGLSVSVKRRRRPSSAAGALSEAAATSNSDENSSDEQQMMMNEEEQVARRQQEEECARSAPCIRLVERPQGVLHIVTICGARVGFGRSMDVQIGGGGGGGTGGLQQENEDHHDDANALLFSIRYTSADDDNAAGGGEYRMKWHSSEVHAEKDGHCLEAGISHSVRHDDLITIVVGPSEQQQILLSFHIHTGLNTCQGCEPGLFNSSERSADGDAPKKRISRYAAHRRQMRALKEQYGLLEEDTSAVGELHDKYVDRAGRRRRAVGSSDGNMPSSTAVLNSAGGIYKRCAATPQPGSSAGTVQLQQQLRHDVASTAAAAVPINADNKGFKLLKGMGWTEGQGLGKNRQGIQGPIAVSFKNDRVGLGTATTVAASKISIQLGNNKQQRNADQMRKRFAQIVEQQSLQDDGGGGGKK